MNDYILIADPQNGTGIRYCGKLEDYLHAFDDFRCQQFISRGLHIQFKLDANSNKSKSFIIDYELDMAETSNPLWERCSLVRVHDFIQTMPDIIVLNETSNEQLITEGILLEYFR